MEACGQVQLFMVIVIAGAAMGIAFDFYRVVRGVFRPKFIITSLIDLIYWLVATIVVFGMLLAGNWGEVRLYVFIALLTGASLYYRFFSRYTLHLIIRVIRIFVGTLRYLRLFLLSLLKPFRQIAKLIIMPFAFVVRKTVQYYRTYRLKP